MNLVVFSSEKMIANEAAFINELFSKGMQHFQLRKPNLDFQSQIDFLEQIDSIHHPKIIIHQHYELLTEFDLKGIHIKSMERCQYSKENLYLLKQIVDKCEKMLITGFHDVKEASKNMEIYDMAFLSPVFDSISKQGYLGNSQMLTLPKMTKPLYALGGIDASKISEIVKAGYQGVGVLGSIWNSENPMASFEKIQQTCHQYAT